MGGSWVAEKPAKPLASSRWVHTQHQSTMSRCTKVRDFLAPDGKEWNTELLRLVLTEES
ncbi:hypothetical protein DY000_02023718 [Brassica cretica]|uniref:Uncharacterized protein n=1 Tax=Brassica cretica TaxID=69181 RepID=A0ABQ7EJR9_BRACR|nr:hypothetical protein DY000_02023718 [Brassica cretica]